MTVRRRRILYATSTFAGVLAVGAVLVYFVVLPWIVRNRVNAVLRAQGLEQFSFHVPIATLRSAMVTDLKIADGVNHIDRLIVRYSVASLRQGRLDSIRVEGMALAVRVAPEGRVDLGPLAPILTHPKLNPATQPAELPADQFELIASEAVVTSPGNTVRLPLEGSAIRTDGSIVKINFRTELGSPVTLSGDANASTSDVHLKLVADDVDARALTRLVAAFIPGLSFGVQGRLQTNATMTRENGKSLLDAQIKTTNTTTQPSATDPNVQLASGVFHLAGAFGPEGSSLNLSVKDASLTEHSQSMEINGVNGDVWLTRFVPLTSPPNQRVQVASVKMGELTLKDGIVEFQVIGPQSIQIQHTQWNTLGGQVIANDATVQDGNVSITLEAQKLDLKQLLDLFAQEKASGQGALSGQIHLAIDHARLTLSGGRLSATGGGILKVAKPEEIAGDIAVPSPNPTAQEQVRRNIIEALKDFQYTKLTADLKQETTGLAVYAHVSGHGRTGARQAIEYDLRLHGLDPIIRGVLKLRGAMSAAENRKGKANP